MVNHENEPGDLTTSWIVLVPLSVTMGSDVSHKYLFLVSGWPCVLYLVLGMAEGWPGGQGPRAPAALGLQDWPH